MVFFLESQHVSANSSSKRLSIDELTQLVKDAVTEERIPEKGKKFEGFFEALMLRG